MADSFPGDLRYTASDEWVRREADAMVVGVTSYAAEQLGDVVYVQLPSIDQHFDVDTAFGEVESVKAVSDLLTPISGTIAAVNEQLDVNPALVNEDPYGAGWLIRLRPDSADAYSSLLTSDEYDRKIAEAH